MEEKKAITLKETFEEYKAFFDSLDDSVLKGGKENKNDVNIRI